MREYKQEEGSANAGSPLQTACRWGGGQSRGTLSQELVPDGAEGGG